MLKQVIFFLLSGFILLNSCTSESSINDHKNVQDTTQVVFDNYVYNFDTIDQGEEIIYSFSFQNVGSSPYLIKRVYSSCGCTVPYKPDKPIKPGEKGYIKVKFNSIGKIGEQHKTIYIEGNTKPSKIELVLKGFVRPPKIQNN